MHRKRCSTVRELEESANRFKLGRPPPLEPRLDQKARSSSHHTDKSGNKVCCHTRRAAGAQHGPYVERWKPARPHTRQRLDS